MNERNDNVAFGAGKDPQTNLIPNSFFEFLIAMADALSVIPAAVLRNLADKLYEKRKNAALEVFFFSLQ